MRRNPNRERELRELGRLERRRAELDPTACAVDRPCDDEYRRAAAERDEHERRRNRA